MSEYGVQQAAEILASVPMPACASTLGWQLLDADPEAGTVRIGFEDRPEFCNPVGFIQGGFLAAMLDDTMGPAVLIRSGGKSFTASINLNVSFVAPAKPGAVFGEGKVVQLGKTIAFVEGVLFDAEGQMIARASTSARIVPTARL